MPSSNKNRKMKENLFTSEESPYSHMNKNNKSTSSNSITITNKNRKKSSLPPKASSPSQKLATKTPATLPQNASASRDKSLSKTNKIKIKNAKKVENDAYTTATNTINNSNDDAISDSSIDLASPNTVKMAESAANAQKEASFSNNAFMTDFDVVEPQEDEKEFPQDLLVMSDDDNENEEDNLSIGAGRKLLAAAIGIGGNNSVSAVNDLAGIDEKDQVILFPQAIELMNELQSQQDMLSPLQMSTLHTGQGDGSDQESDSSDDENEATLNRVGDIPLEWYKGENHIGYDVEGRKLHRKERGALQQLLDETDDPNAYRTIYDALHDEKKTLSNTELEMIFNLQRNRTPNSSYDMYADYPEGKVQFDPLNHPLARAHGPSKKLFVPKLHEMKIIAKMVKRLLAGNDIKDRNNDETEQNDNPYMLWEDSKAPELDNKTKFKYLHRIPKPRIAPPGTYESYRPPAEYLPSAKTKEKFLRLRRIDRKEHFLPEQFDALRHVPFYHHTLQDRYQRCLDLAFFPRRTRTRLVVDKDKLDSLLPELPDPKDLRPYPERLSFLYKGHTATVRSISLNSSGEYLATACDDHILRIFEVLTGRLVKRYDMRAPVTQVLFNPNSNLNILSVVVNYSIVFIVPYFCAGHAAINEHSIRFLRVSTGGVSASNGGDGFEGTEKSTDVSAVAAASLREATGSGITQTAVDADETMYEKTVALDDADEKEKRAEFIDASTTERNAGFIVKILMHAKVKRIVFHPRGDYMCALCPKDHVKYRQTIMLQLSKRKVFCPFRKFTEIVTDCSFHPQGEPLFYLSTTNSVRVYNLLAQKLQKRYKCDGGVTTCLTLHSGGNNFIVGDSTHHTSWFDCDFSDKPYKRMRTHKGVVNTVEFHKCQALSKFSSPEEPIYPLFASGASDGQVHVFYGKVFDDYNKNAMVVPVKILKHSRPVYAMCWHPSLPWLFTSAEDGTVCCWTE